MRPKCYVLVRYSIGMSGMRKRRRTSYPQGNLVVGQWCRVPGPLAKINGLMDSTKNQDILAENLVASATRCVGR